MRSEEERMERPDTYMEGLRYISLPVLEEGMLGISEAGGLGTMLFQLRGNIEEYMEQQYASLVLDQLCLNQFARFFDILLHQEEGAVLYHCTEGKDITGVATALLLYVLGVPKRAIREEFMRTNEFLAEETPAYFGVPCNKNGCGREDRRAFVLVPFGEKILRLLTRYFAPFRKSMELFSISYGEFFILLQRPLMNCRKSILYNPERRIFS